MRLNKLSIKEFRNLRDFQIDFDENSYRTAVLGRNGTGKSNLLEALIIIFRDLSLNKPPEFSYELTYDCRGQKVVVSADIEQERPAERLKMQIKNPDDQSDSYERVAKKDWKNYLPSYVFGYYSGASGRMESLFEDYQTLLFNEQVYGKAVNVPPQVYAQLVYSQFALLAFLDEENDKIAEFLRETLKIEELVSALFIMRQPPWKSHDGDPRFWNAKGEVQTLLSNLYNHALAPMKIEKQRTNIARAEQRLDHWYFYLPGNNRIANLINEYESPQAFFNALQSTDLSQIISEVRIKLKIVDSDNQVTYREMSEGEQQLLMVLGLLRFTKTEEALFLLDEPDTHLNPTWSIQYFKFLKDVVGEQPTSHIILTTHNPLLVSNLKRTEVQILQPHPKTNAIIALPPRKNPTGMGIIAILTDLFDLRSTLDLETQGKLDLRRELAAQDYLSNEQLNELAKLNSELEGLDYAISNRDPLYRLFVEEMTRRKGSYVGQIELTQEQRDAQRQLAQEIIRELRSKEKLS